MLSKQNILEEGTYLETLDKKVLRVLLYFNLFQYPLELKEIHANLDHKATEAEVAASLKSLLALAIIRKRDEFYYLGTSDHIIDRRRKGNQVAEKYLIRARKVTKFISSFPFIRGVYISGSLSKGYMDEKDGDIDYFVITEPGRLWLIKAILALTKKVFLLNSKKYFCFNYFIDSEHLAIPDQNLFTAKELMYLIPMYNEKLYWEMVAQNQWAQEYLPNFTYVKKVDPIEVTHQKRKQVWEFLFRGIIGAGLDKLSMKTFEFFWKRKYKAKGENDLRVRCHKHVSKIHPNNFQVKVLHRLNEEEKKLHQEFKLIFADEYNG